MRKSEQKPKAYSRLLGKEDLKKLLDEETGLFVQPILDEDIQIGPSSIDLRLDSYFMEIKHTASDVVKPDVPTDPSSYTSLVEVDPSKDSYTLQPGKFVIGQTLEYIRLPENIYGILDGRSSLGRLGVVVHSTASSVDPGWEGHLTLELGNNGEMGVKMIPLMRVARLILFETPGHYSYSSQPESERKYFRQTKPTPSRIYEDKDFQKMNAIRKIRKDSEQKELQQLLN
jgi:dCTP deaminase